MGNILILSGDDMSFYKFRKELIVELSNMGHNVLLATYFEKYQEKLAVLGCKTRNVKSLNRRGSNVFQEVLLYFEYKKIIKEFKPDIIMTYTLKPRVYGNLASGKIPIINTITGMGAYTLDNKLVSAIATFLDKWGLKHTQCVFFQNSESRDIYYERKMLSKSIPTFVVHASGVNTDDFKFLDYPVHDEINFAFIGRIMKDKGVEELFYSAEKLKELYPEMPININVYGFYEENYKGIIDDLENRGIIRYYGFVDDIRTCYNEIDCVVLPSYHEGVGNAIQEAASSGRPVITTDIPGCRTVVDDGENGFLCEPRSKESLFDCMNRFVRLPREKRMEMGKKGRLKMEKEHDRKLVIKEYVNAISMILNG